MAKMGHGYGQGTKPQVEPGQRRDTSRKLDADVALAQQYARDALRGATEPEIERSLARDMQDAPGADDELAGDLTDENLTAEAMAPNMSEISIADEDDFNDSMDADEISTAAPVEAGDTPDAALPWDCSTIAVIGDRAEFRIPDWAQSFTKDDLDLRWETYTRVAAWLTRDRQEFLRNPSFMALVGTSVTLTPPIAVLQNGLHQMLGLACDIATFSKHAGACFIVWPNRQLQLDALWSQEAKLAWCAQAAIQRQRDRGYAGRGSDLGQCDIQPPRSKAEKANCVAAAGMGWGLRPRPFVELLCALTKCSWRDVLDRYGNVIFSEG